MEDMKEEEKRQILDFLCRKTKEIWHAGLSAPEVRTIHEDLDMMEEKCLLIGTDRMESIRDGISFWEILKRDCEKPGLLGLYIIEEWYDGRMLGRDGAIVCGNVRMGTTMDADYNLDVRFTIAYERVQGNWEIIHIHNSLPKVIEHNELGKIYTVVEQAEQAVAMAEKLKNLARMDQMTEVYNHKTFLDIAEQIALKQTQNPYCFIIDLDNFKKINDTYGHLEGDRVLKILADVLREQTRSGDLVGRIGGDEFAILCLQVPEDGTACRIAERIIGTFQERTRMYGDEKLFGLSVGIAKMNHGENFYKTLKNADRSLYQAKKCGKKTYCLYQEES